MLWFFLSMNFFAQLYTYHTRILSPFYCLLFMCGGIQLVNWVRSRCFWFLTKCPKLFKQGVSGELANILAPPGISLFAWEYIHTGTATPQPFVQTKHVFLNIHEQHGAQTRLNQTAAQNSWIRSVNRVWQCLTSSRYCCLTGAQTSWNVDSSNSRLKNKSNQRCIYMPTISYCV